MNLENLEEEMRSKGFKEAYIQTCLEYAGKLKANELPIIFDSKHLSLLMGLNVTVLYSYYIMADSLYNKIKVPKKTGGHRELFVPSENLKFIQRWLLSHILYKCKVHRSVNGFVREKSIINNAQRHIGKEVVVNLDIKDFFPSISSKQIYLLFIEMGYSKHLSKVFTGLCTSSDILPQGAPTSPYLSNLICRRLDERLENLAEKIQASYSRYADDITFSGSKDIRKYIALIKRVIVDEGFIVNEKKVRVQFQYHRQMVTGLIVNNKLSVPQKTKKYLRQQIYYCQKFGVKDNLKKQNIFKSNYKEHLYGMAYFIKMVEQDVGLNFLNELDKIDWEG